MGALTRRYIHGVLTCATLLLLAGVSPKIVAESWDILNHSDPGYLFFGPTDHAGAGGRGSRSYGVVLDKGHPEPLPKGFRNPVERLDSCVEVPGILPALVGSRRNADGASAGASVGGFAGGAAPIQQIPLLGGSVADRRPEGLG